MLEAHADAAAAGSEAVGTEEAGAAAQRGRMRKLLESLGFRDFTGPSGEPVTGPSSGPVIRWDPVRVQAEAALDRNFRSLDKYLDAEDDRLWELLSRTE